MLELILAVTIFAFAMVPVLFMTQRSVQGTYSISKHLIASQICISILDKLLAMPYADAKKVVEAHKDKEVKVLDESNTDNLAINAKLGELMRSVPVPEKQKNKDTPLAFEDDIQRYIKSFSYSLSMTEETVKDNKNPPELMLIKVKLTWQIDDKDEKTKHFMTRQALKIREDS